MPFIQFSRIRKIGRIFKFHNIRFRCKIVGRTRDGRVKNVKLISDRKMKEEIIVKDSSFVLNILMVFHEGYDRELGSANEGFVAVNIGYVIIEFLFD